MIFKCANSVRFYTTVSVRLQFLCQQLIYELIFSNWNEKKVTKRNIASLVTYRLRTDTLSVFRLVFSSSGIVSLLLSAFWFHEILLCIINRMYINVQKESYFKSIYVRGATDKQYIILNSVLINFEFKKMSLMLEYVRM